jgi:hypothetical protein
VLVQHLLRDRTSDAEHFWSTLQGLDQQATQTKSRSMFWSVSRMAPHRLQNGGLNAIRPIGRRVEFRILLTICVLASPTLRHQRRSDSSGRIDTEDATIARGDHLRVSMSAPRPHLRH